MAKRPDEVITFRCESELKKELKKESERADLTLTQLLRKIAREYLVSKA